MRSKTYPIILGGLAVVALAYYYKYGKDQSYGSAYRPPRTQPIPLPEKPEDAIAFRAFICDYAARGHAWGAEDVLNSAYAGLGAQWPMVEGDHESMKAAIDYVNNLITEYNADPAAFCKTGF